MIYTIISDVYGREIDVNKRDCRILRQPLPCFSREIEEYISKTSNENLKNERFCAYVSLFSALKQFFDLDSPIIKRAESGKPYLDNSPDIYFNISHSNGVVALTISSEGQVGVDVQSETNDEKQERLEKRFLSDIKIPNQKEQTTTKNQKINYYISKINGESIEFCKIHLNNADPEVFTSKWTYAESIIKLTGNGFADISNVSAIAENSKTSIKKFSVDNTKFALSTSIKI